MSARALDLARVCFVSFWFSLHRIRSHSTCERRRWKSDRPSRATVGCCGFLFFSLFAFVFSFFFSSSTTTTISRRSSTSRAAATRSRTKSIAPPLRTIRPSFFVDSYYSYHHFLFVAKSFSWSLYLFFSLRWIP